MDFDLNEEQRDIQRTARELLESRVTAERRRGAAESWGTDDPLWDEIRELGWPGIAISEELGGAGLGMVELCVLLEQHGAALAPTPLLETACVARVLSRVAGSGGIDRDGIEALAAGEATAAIGAVTDSGAAFVAGPAEADMVALLDGDRGLVARGGELSIRAEETIDPLRSYGWVDSIPGEGDLEEIDPAGFLEAAVAVAAELTGVCQRALEMTLEFVKEREQFGVPVGSFQAVSHRCAEMLLATESARSATYFAAWAADADPERLPEAAALAKSTASSAAVSVTSSAIQAHGGIGFTWEADLHWWYKRAQLSAQLLGGTGHHRARLAELVIADLQTAYSLGDKVPNSSSKGTE